MKKEICPQKYIFRHMNVLVNCILKEKREKCIFFENSTGHKIEFSVHVTLAKMKSAIHEISLICLCILVIHYLDIIRVYHEIRKYVCACCLLFALAQYHWINANIILDNNNAHLWPHWMKVINKTQQQSILGMLRVFFYQLMRSSTLALFP